MKQIFYHLSLLDVDYGMIDVIEVTLGKYVMY